MSILTRSVGLAGHGRAGSRSIDSIGRNKGSLRRDRMEETLLVESNTVLATSIG